MAEKKLDKDNLRAMIAAALGSGTGADGALTRGSRANVDELLEEIHIYYQELEFQNDELQRARTELEASNARYEDLFMNAPMGYVIYDETYRVLSMNRRLRNMLGMKQTSESSMHLDQYVVPDSQDAFYLHVRSVLRGDGAQSARISLAGRDGPLNVMFESNQTEDGGKKVVRSAVSDMSVEDALSRDLASTRLELEIRNHELQEYHDRLEATMLAGNLAWWRLNLLTGAVVFNENKTKLLGYEAKDFTRYTHFTAFVHPDDYNPMMQAMHDYIDGKVPAYRTEYRIRTAAGDYRWFQDIGVASSRNIDGRPVSMFGVVIDTTEIKAMQLEAQRANNAKSEFLANMSHEIRTPLNAIVGFTELLRSAPLDDEYREYLENAHESAKTLMELVSDLLDLSKIEAGKLELDEIPVNLASILERVIAMFRPAADKKGLALRLVLPEGFPAQVIVDPVRLKQVVINLISNAIKFTDAGSVDVIVGYIPVRPSSGGTAETREAGRFSFEIRDSGIGISEQQRNRLFKAFSQADTSITRRFGGTGLGLTISGALVQKMGGEINVTSVPGQGSVFSFSIEKNCEAAPPVTMMVNPVHAGIAGTGQSGTPVPGMPDAGSVTAGKTAASRVVPDSVVETDGQASRRLHAGEPAGRQIPRVLQSFQRRVNILVAEDVTMNRLLVQAIIRRILPNAVWTVAVDGSEAVDAVRRGGIDLVLMDIQMPVLDGYAATRQIRQLEESAGTGAHVPIIALTASVLPEDVARCLEAGMDAYLSKPIDSSALHKALVEVLSLGNETPATGGATVPAGAPADDGTTKSASSLPELKGPHFDKNTLTASVGGDAGLVRQMIDLGQTQFVIYMQDLESAVNAGSWLDLKRAAHKFKGAALTLACTRLGKLLLELEAAAEEGLEPKAAALVKAIAFELGSVQTDFSDACRDS